MFWFIPMIASAVSGQMQKNNQRANQTMQDNTNRVNNNSMSLPTAKTDNTLYNKITNKEDDVTNNESGLYRNLVSPSSSTSAPTSTTPEGTSLGTNTTETAPPSDNSTSQSFIGSGEQGSGGAGGWASMAQSLMGAMQSSTPTVSFTPSMVSPNYVNTNSSNRIHSSNMANIGKPSSLYERLIR